MQNIDFSSRIRSAQQHRVAESHKPEAALNPMRGRNRVISFTLAALIFIFAIGMYLGIQIGKTTQIENPDCVVRYPNGEKNAPVSKVAADSNQTSSTSNELEKTPEKESGSTTSLANTAARDRTYIIKVGQFKPGTANKLARQLGSLAEIRQLQAQKCKGIRESDPDRMAVFRMQASDNKESENVLVGCFQKAARANHILSVVRKSGLPGSSRAELYEY